MKKKKDKASTPPKSKVPLKKLEKEESPSETTDYGGMDLTNFKRGMGCGG